VSAATTTHPVPWGYEPRLACGTRQRDLVGALPIDAATLRGWSGSGAADNANSSFAVRVIFSCGAARMAAHPAARPGSGHNDSHEQDRTACR